MAENDEDKKPSRNLLKYIKVPEKVVPQKFKRSLELSLANANISFSAQEWMGMFTIVGIILLVIFSLIFNIFIGLVLFGTVLFFMVFFPKMQADNRRAQIEEALPDALHHMSVSIRTGLVLEAVIQEVSEAEYGALSDEFSQIVMEMRRGRTLKDALLGFAKRTGSKDIERSMRLLLEGIESGGPIADVLDEVSDDIRAVRTVQRERKSLTSQQISFLAMASLMAGPFVMGVVGALPDVMANAMASTGQAQDFPIDKVRGIVQALSFYVFAQAVSSALMMGVVMYGDMKKGLKFALPMGIVAYGIFTLIKKVLPTALAAF